MAEKKHNNCSHVHPSLHWVTDQLPEVQMARRIAPRGVLYLRAGDYLQSWAIVCNTMMILHSLNARIQNQMRRYYGDDGSDASYAASECISSILRSSKGAWQALLPTKEIIEHRYMRSSDKRLQTAARAALIAEKTAWKRSWDIFLQTNDLKAANVPWTEAVADLTALSGAPLLKEKLVELFKRTDKPELRPGEVPCDKCGGLGVIPSYIHVDGGVCYDCGGSGREEDTWRAKRK